MEELILEGREGFGCGWWSSQLDVWGSEETPGLKYRTENHPK